MPYTFLPGGHVDFGESTPRALAREMGEELGAKVVVRNFLGAVEHLWDDENGKNHEINLIFLVESDDIHPDAASLEAHLEFLWQDVDNLGSARLEPSALVELIPQWLSGNPSLNWGSTI